MKRLSLTNEQISYAQNQLSAMLTDYEGARVSDIKAKLTPGNSEDSKASFAVLARRMLKTSNNQIKLPGANQVGTIKTIRITGNDKPAESMSFTSIKFEQWAKCENWHDSSMYQYFKNTPLIFFVFQQFPSGKRVPDNQIRFKNIKVWQMSDYDLEHGIKELWLEVRRLITSDELKIVPKQHKDGKTVNTNNLPGISFNGIAHLRPGGKNGEDKVTLPNGQKIASQRFWLNADYIRDMLS